MNKIESVGILLPSFDPADMIELTVERRSIGKYSVVSANASGPIAEIIIA